MLHQQHEEFMAFANTLAHALSIPLSIIRRSAELLALEQRANAHPHEQRYVDTILEATTHMMAPFAARTEKSSS
jgi:nitrogen-specific signal transduction histidine kinase